jgi:phosphoribosylaminoimidazole-succinocarboxamide synthase
VLTPDSSRYWPASEYEVGISPPSFDKQYVRDHYLATDWDRLTPPAPRLPAEVIAGTRARYVEAYELITGSAFADWYR